MTTLKTSLKVFTNILAVLILSVVLAFGLKLALAAVWQEPTQAPPNGQPDAPINVGSASQTKTGALTVGGLTSSADSDTLLTLSRDGATYPTTFRLGTDSAFVINNSGIDTITLKNGNVGIGTTDPSARLDIANVGGNDNVPILVMSEDENDEFAFKGDFAGSGPGGNILKLVTYWGNTAMSWKGDGYVGIGTAEPQEKLNVYVGGGNPAIAIGRSSNNYYRIGMAGWNSYIVNNAYYNGSQWNYINTAGYSGRATRIQNSWGKFSFATANNAANPVSWNERLTILNNGNVGIGITGPQEKLHINGSIRGNQNGAIRISTGNGYVDVGPKNSSWSHFITDRGRFYFNKGITVDSGSIGSYNENLHLQTSGITRMTILNSNGNVGIGTTNPPYKLDLWQDNSTWAARFVNNSGGGGMVYLAGKGYGAYIRAGTDASASTYVLNVNKAGGTPYLYVRGDGKVGIGTASPNHELDVSGVLDVRGIEIRPDEHYPYMDPYIHFSYPGFGYSMTLKLYGNQLILTGGDLRVHGNIYKTGEVSFVEDYPGDPSKEIVYVSLEGPEAGTYIRGTAECKNNEAIIIFPDHFRLVTSENGLTAQLTPRLTIANLYIKKLTNEKLIVGCNKETYFDYLVNGIRKGYENHQIIREKDK